jgi:hypothetical protein
LAIRLLGSAGPGRTVTFRGTLDPDARRARGTIKGPVGVYRARIERTEAKTLATPNREPSAYARELAGIQMMPSPKARVAKFLELINAHPGDPINPIAYGQVVMMAESAGLSAEEVARIVGRWFDEANPFGPGWIGETQAQVLKALQGKKDYATLATEERSAIANLLAESAKLAGNEALAAEAAGRARESDAKIDLAYLAQIPPFKTPTYAGRPGGKGSRVVVMELFTGAECPPCVAADVAFDGLLKTYKPTEFIGLQYHLHVPNSDPLTNPDGAIRAEVYYRGEIQGTPTAFFNGSSATR